MNDDFWPGVIVATILWCCIFSWVIQGVNNSWRDQIEAHGCGGWYLDANRVKQWDWTQPLKEQK